jgi:sugar lactone lactonase YvrE
MDRAMKHYLKHWNSRIQSALPVVVVCAALLGSAQPSLAADQYVLVDSYHSPDPQDVEHFGKSIAQIGNLLIVGSPQADVGGQVDAGVVYVFDADKNVAHTFTSPSPVAEAFFGISVAAKGSDLLIGAVGDVVDGVRKGSVYLFNCDTSSPEFGQLLTQYKLDGGQAGDGFGECVRVGQSGEIIIGAPHRGDGTLHVFTGGPVSTIANPTPGLGTGFGWWTTVADSRIVVSAPFGGGAFHVVDPSSSTVLLSGAAGGEFGRKTDAAGHLLLAGDRQGKVAYLYDLNTGAQLQSLHAPAGLEKQFGWATLITDSEYIVSDIRGDEAPFSDSGKVYVFDSQTYDLKQTLYNPSRGAGDIFGHNFLLAGDSFYVSALGDTVGGMQSGAVYRYQKVASPEISLSESSMTFGGVQIGISESLVLTITNTGEGDLIVSEITSSDAQFAATPTTFTVTPGGTQDVHVTFTPSSEGSKAATITIASNDPDEGTLSVSLWGMGMATLVLPRAPLVLEQRLSTPSPDAGDHFGVAVAPFGDKVIVGAFKDDTGFRDAGAVYVLASDGQTTLTLPNPAPGETNYFGQSVAAVGDNILVGAWGGSGAAYLFDGTTGELILTLLSPAGGRFFGHSVSSLGRHLLVGAYGDNTGAPDAGAAYLFDGETGNLLETFLNPTPEQADYFGVAVLGAGTRVLVGAYGDHHQGGTSSGAVYLFDGDSSSPSFGALLQTFRSPVPADADGFGFSLAALGDIAIIGGIRTEAVYLFDLVTGNLIRTITNPAATDNANFGHSVAAYGASVVVGAPGGVYSGPVGYGAVYIFDPITGSMLDAIASPDPGFPYLFGHTVAAGPNRVLVGAPDNIYGQGPTLPGLVYEYGTGVGDIRISQTITTVAESGTPWGLCSDGSGNLYVAERDNNRVVRIDGLTGTVTTVAGNGTRGYSGDGGPATLAGLGSAHDVALDSSGNIYIADAYAHRIRKVDARTGLISTLAGNGDQAFSGDQGLATNAALNFPQRVSIDDEGNVFVADTQNHRIRVVARSTGIITTFLGNGTAGNTGDGGPASDAQLNSPRGVCSDAAGNVYVADAYNHRIRRVDAGTGVISNFAGTGEPGFAGDGGPATGALLSHPVSVSLDASGNLYLVSNENGRVRRVDAATGVITTVVGDGDSRFSGDGGLATEASLASPWGIHISTSGDIYIADTNNGRIRRVTSPSELHFADTMAGNSSDLTLIISNTGSAGLSVTRISSSDGQFVISPTSFTVEPSGRQNAVVTFTPSNTGPQSAILAITSDDPDESTLTVALSGNGIVPGPAAAPEIDLSPTSVDFGDVIVGQSLTRTLTVSNLGNAILSLTSIESPHDEVTAGLATGSVEPGGQLALTVTYAPTGIRDLQGFMTIRSNDSDEGSLLVSVGGRGVAAGDPPVVESLSLKPERAGVIASLMPTFYWTFSDGDDHDQAAWQIQVGSEPGVKDTDIWDSGKQDGQQRSTGYSGSTLEWATVYGIRIRVWDSSGMLSAWKQGIFETLDNQPPIVKIDSPQDGTIAVWDSIAELRFSGTVQDGDEGGVRIDSLVWFSDLDGVLKTGSSSQDANFKVLLRTLPVGDRVITLRAWDDEGDSTSQQVSLSVLGLAPVGQISSVKVNGEEIDPDLRIAFATLLGAHRISFSGSATDGDEFGQAIRAHLWTSRSLPGASVQTLSQDSAFTVAASDLGTGTHVVRYVVTDDEGAESAGDSVTVIVRQDVGRAIIVAGGGYRGENWDAFSQYTWSVTDKVYSRLIRQRRYSQEFVTYLNPFYDPRDEDIVVDGAASVAGLREAIDDAARDNVDHGVPLLIFLAGHGGEATFYIGDDEALRPEDLKAWLDELVNEKVTTRGLSGPEEAPAEEIVLVVDFCYSRTFLEKLKGPGRIVVGSSSTEVASVIAGESFGSFFFDGVSRGWDVWRSFEEALVRVKKSFDQTPYLDADGDGIPVYGENGKRNPGTEGDEWVSRNTFVGGEFINLSRLNPEIYEVDVQKSGEERGAFLIEAAADSGLTLTFTVVPSQMDAAAQLDLSEMEYGQMTLSGMSDGRAIYSSIHRPADSGDYTVLVRGRDGLGNVATHQVAQLTYSALEGDFDGDGVVGFQDFLGFAQAYGARVGEPGWDSKYDLNGDDEVGFEDFIRFAQVYGRSS